MSSPETFVRLDLTVQVEVVDVAALREAAAAAGLTDTNDLASCVGVLARAGRAVDGIPGVERRGSGASASLYSPP